MQRQEKVSSHIHGTTRHAQRAKVNISYIRMKCQARTFNRKIEAETAMGSVTCASTSLTLDQPRVIALLAILLYMSAFFFFF